MQRGTVVLARATVRFAMRTARIRIATVRFEMRKARISLGTIRCVMPTARITAGTVLFEVRKARISLGTVRFLRGTVPMAGRGSATGLRASPQERSATAAPGAFVFTASMPFSMPDQLLYPSLRPMVFPLIARRTK